MKQNWLDWLHLDKNDLFIKPGMLGNLLIVSSYTTFTNDLIKQFGFIWPIAL
jgi:hypothetical protein